ncbi:MAG: putative glycolipid-binding domain-containing protein, partial [Acidobacteria bacterium]|nr:putative glycolipid-binding domain-containing protein [Acidobacteriota bacterium]
IVLGVKEDIAYRIRYQVRCDSNWQVRKVVVTSLAEKEQSIALTSDGSGNWMDESGAAIYDFKDCLDVDISVTPFTNTLPIRRLRLNRGASSEIKAVYVAVPEMQLSVERQRYTFIESNGAGSKYKFESLDGEFTAIISVDADGIVADYPNLFRLVWAS